MEILDAGVSEERVLRGDVDQPGLRIERHGLPVVAAERAGLHDGQLLFVSRRRDFDGATRLLVYAFGPVHRHVGFGRKQLASGAIEHVEEAVLRRLHQHLALTAIDVEVGKNDVLRRREVPAFARRRLIVPDQLAAVGLERQDRREVKVIAAAGTA